MSSKPAERPRPPSVELVLARVRERLDGRREAAAVLAIAREVVDAERSRLHGDGAAPRAAESLADDVLARLDSFAGPILPAPPLVGRASTAGLPVHDADRADP